MSGRTLRVINSGTGENIETVAHADREDLDRALAWESPASNPMGDHDAVILVRGVKHERQMNERLRPCSSALLHSAIRNDLEEPLLSFGTA